MSEVFKSQFKDPGVYKLPSDCCVGDMFNSATLFELFRKGSATTVPDSWIKFLTEEHFSEECALFAVILSDGVFEIFQKFEDIVAVEAWAAKNEVGESFLILVGEKVKGFHHHNALGFDKVQFW